MMIKKQSVSFQTFKRVCSIIEGSGLVLGEETMWDEFYKCPDLLHLKRYSLLSQHYNEWLCLF